MPVTRSRRPQIGLALLLLAAAVVLGALRSRRTGIELGLLALSQVLYAAAPRPGRRGPMRIAAAAIIVAVIGIAVEPHVH